SGTSLAVYPLDCTVCIMLLFPYRKPRFYLVNNVAAGREGLFPMLSYHCYPDGRISYFQLAHAVDAKRFQNAKALLGLRNDQFPLFRAKLFISFILKLYD